MNYLRHAIIGIGTASLGVMAAEALGSPHSTPFVIGAGALIRAFESIAPDLDHPKSFISNTIPTRVIRLTMAVLIIPLLAGLGSLLTTQDILGTLSDFAAMVLGVYFLRWTAITLCLSLGLMSLSWILYKSLHHRGPLHSLIFTAVITLMTGAILGILRFSLVWSLAFGWGWLWHILADGMTMQGAPFFWPITDLRKHTMPVWILDLGRGLLTLAAFGGIAGLIIDRLQPLLS